MKSILFILLISSSLLAEDDEKNNRIKNDDKTKKYQINYYNLKDTLYTLGDYFIEVNLSNQMAYLHSRYDSTRSFGVSTGTKRIKDGIETEEGIFTIQFKVEKWHSIQFDSTLMLNFMTFNWGIGFHALAGNNYYKYLGVKKSSHGCVRISRTIARELYQKIKYGTPVIVHKGNPAVTIAFATKEDTDIQYLSNFELKHIVTNRLEELYKGNYFLSYKNKLLIDNKNVNHFGLPVGDGNKINKRQILKPDYLFVDYAMPEIMGYNISQNKPAQPFQLILAKGKIPHPTTFIEDLLD
jgi:hypothetical protein